MKTSTALCCVVLVGAGVIGWYHSCEIAPEAVIPVTLVQKAVAESPKLGVAKQEAIRNSEHDSFVSNAAAESPELGVAKQKAIWELEHYTFELEQKFGTAFTAALKDRKRESLLPFFRDEFSGVILDSDGGTRVGGNWWHEIRRVAGASNGPSERPADKRAVAEYLVTALDDFSRVDRAKLRVLTIAEDPVGRNKSSQFRHEPIVTPMPELRKALFRPTGKSTAARRNDQWKLKLLLTASGTNVNGGPISWESTHDVRCQFATDEDIVSGEIISSWIVLDDFIRSAPTTFMKEVTKEVGLKELELPDNWESNEYPRQADMQIAVDDFNSDGYPDIAVSCLAGRQYLLQSVQGKSFQDVTLEVGLPTAASSCFLVSWIDFDNDGDADLLMGGAVYRNDGGRHFEDVTTASGLRLGEHPMGCAVVDYDADGFLDLYVLYDVLYEYSIRTGKTGWLDDADSGAPNQLWRNVNGKFVDVTDETGTAGGKRHSFAAVWLHANNDMRPDLYVANDFGTNLLLINRGGRFEEVAATAHVGDFATSMGVAAGDIDGDGQPEIYVANMYSKMGRRIIDHVCADDYPPGVFEQIEGSCAGNRLYKRSPEAEHYDELAIPLGVNDVGWAYAPALVDLDCDGFLDIYATTGFLSFDRKKPDG